MATLPMNQAKAREYLEAKVLTASPAQLHLMLIEGALRHGREAEKGLLRGDELAYHAPLIKTIDFVGEMLAGVRHRGDELNLKLQRLYEFLLARLTSVYVRQDHKAMGEALRILAFEAETWRMACEKVAREAAPAAGPAPAPHTALAGPSAAAAAGLATGSLSLEC